MAQTECPAPEVLREYLLGTLPLEEARRWDEHVLQCKTCCELANQLESCGDLRTAAESESVQAFITSAEQNPRFQESIQRFVLRQIPPADSEEILVDEKSQYAPGSCLGNYRVLTKLGQGGMGVVYKAEHLETHGIVALKVILPKYVGTPEAARRFLRETELVFQLHHPQIVRALDSGMVDGVHFLVMEYVEGGNLSDLVRKLGPLPVEQAVTLSIQAARGLQFAHDQGIVHRDIKPRNLLVDAAGSLKIADLGLARINLQSDRRTTLTNTGMVMGTAEFLSPEQALDSKDADARSDIYALGCTLFYLLTARPVYDESTMMKTLIAHREAPIPSLSAVRPDIPASLDYVFQNMVAKRPTARYQSMTAVAEALQQALLPPSIDQAGTEQAEFFARRRGWMRAGLLVLFLMLSAIGGMTSRWVRSRFETNESPAIQLRSAPLVAQPVIDPFPPAAHPLPEDAPARAVAPFDSATALRHQQAWADYLGGPLETINSQQVRLRLIPPGDFRMGMTEQEIATMLQVDADAGKNASEANFQYMPFKPATPADFVVSRPSHSVRITQPFYLGTCEISRGQYRQFVKDSGYQTDAERELRAVVNLDDRHYKLISATGLFSWLYSHLNAPLEIHPAIFISWNDAAAYCSWLSAKEGVKYRLPTEAEWEYACRAGTTSVWWHGNDSQGLMRIANTADGIELSHAPATNRVPQRRGLQGFYFGDGHLYSAPVGDYLANPFGLYDMHGNAAEWCLDFFDQNLPDPEPVNDPQGPVQGAERVLRGGGWSSRFRGTCSGIRNHEQPQIHYGDFGFRVLREIPVVARGSLSKVLPAPPSPPRDSAVEVDAVTSPKQAPALATSPFDAATARKQQETWARSLGTPPEISSLQGYLFTLIPPGLFQMGLSAEDQGLRKRIDEQSQQNYADAHGSLSLIAPDKAEKLKCMVPEHLVQITKPFYLGVREVTRGNFQLFVQETKYVTEAEMAKTSGPPSQSWSNPVFGNVDNAQPESHPVVNVTYNDALKFCEWLSRREKLTCRLPTEAEWEYACRAGTRTLWSHGNDLKSLKDSGNVADGMFLAKAPASGRITQVSGLPGFYFPDGYLFTAPSGLFRPNAFGLYDMHGNIQEWCADWYSCETYGHSPKADPQGPMTGTDRILRGGSWRSPARDSLSGSRSWAPPNYRAPDVGFRIVREITP